MRLKRFGLAALALLALGALGPASASGQGITQEQADAILQELRQIRQLLERSQPPGAPRQVARDERVKLPAAAAYALGSESAPVTIVEFTDVQCPFCRQFHISTFEQLKKDYVDTGKLRFVTRDLPLDFHKQAFNGAHATRCAGEQKKFWEMRHVLLVNASNLSDEGMFTFARDLGLDMERFGACHKSQKHRAGIQQDIDDARAAGITGTPTFIVGKSGQEIEGVKIVGAQPYGAFEAKIKELLSAKP